MSLGNHFSAIAADCLILLLQGGYFFLIHPILLTRKLFANGLFLQGIRSDQLCKDDVQRGQHEKGLKVTEVDNPLATDKVPYQITRAVEQLHDSTPETAVDIGEAAYHISDHLPEVIPSGARGLSAAVAEIARISISAVLAYMYVWVCRWSRSATHQSQLECADSYPKGKEK